MVAYVRLKLKQNLRSLSMYIVGEVMKEASLKLAEIAAEENA
jgi:hypothetical protein